MTQQPTLKAIVAATVDETGFNEWKLLGDSKTRQLARARQAGYWAASECGYSYPQVGRAFAKDHSSVIHGCKKVDADDDLMAVAKRILDRARDGVGFEDAPTQSLFERIVDAACTVTELPTHVDIRRPHRHGTPASLTRSIIAHVAMVRKVGTTNIAHEMGCGVDAIRQFNRKIKLDKERMALAHRVLEMIAVRPPDPPRVIAKATRNDDGILAFVPVRNAPKGPHDPSSERTIWAQRPDIAAKRALHQNRW